jgi:hypothetical protein
MNSYRKQGKENPLQKSWVTTNAKLNTGYYNTPKGAIDSAEAGRNKMNESRNMISKIRNEGKKAALQKLTARKANK